MSTDNAPGIGDPAPGEEPHVLVLDNYDSFTYNLVEYLSEHAQCTVRTNDVSLDTLKALAPDAIVISPGPGHPANDRDIGVTRQVLKTLSQDVPTLGVCLGLEAAVHTFGGTVDRGPAPIHGKASPIDHDGRGVFAGLEQGFQGGRYHSLVATTIPDVFSVTARTETDEGELVMGIRHTSAPISCVQFHPESVLTAVGHDLIENFLTEARQWAESESSVWTE